VKSGTDIGRRVKTIIEAGGLVPDEIVIRLIAECIEKPQSAKGFILDGFPRSLGQASALDKMLADKGTKMDLVVELKVDPNRLVERIVGRYTCTKCGEGYHDRFKQPKVAGVCDVCGNREFSRRADDNAETVTTRLMAYYRETSPLIGYYYCKGNLRSVDGMAPIGDVAKAIDALIEAAGR
jgi:adenylate kinase